MRAPPFSTARLALNHALTAVAVALAMAGVASAAERGLMVFVAASTADAMQEVSDRFAAQSDVRVRLSPASSSMLARQIANGAPAHAYLSANPAWMDYLEQRGLIVAETRVDLLGNNLVLVAPSDSTLSLVIEPGFSLAALLGDGRLAIGDPDHVPAGIYAKAALETLGVWHEVAARLVRAIDVRSALVFVARGEAAAGVVYSTDAAISPRVRIAGVFPAATHPPIVYPFGLVSDGIRPAAERFAAYLSSPEAREIFLRHGFKVLPAARSDG